MKTSGIEIETHQAIAHLYLNRPHARNAIDAEMMQALAQTLSNLAEDPACLAVYLKARGKHFSAGADLNWMKQQANMSFEENKQDADQLAQLMYQLDHFPKPTVAFVQGCAYGGALGLIACCDIAIAKPDARFCLSEVKLGLVPAIISPYLIRSMGESTCRALMVSADVFHGTQALAYGLLHEVSDQFLDLEQKYQTLFSNNSTYAMQQVKLLIKHISEQPIDAHVIKHTTETIARLRTQEEAQARMSQFLGQQKQ